MADPLDIELDVEVPTVAFATSQLSIGVNADTSGNTVIIVAEPGPRGQEGPIGPSGSGARIIGEEIQGTKDGVNSIFTLSGDYNSGSIAVYRDGVRGTQGYDFIELPPNQIQFVDPPKSHNLIVADYIIG